MFERALGALPGSLLLHFAYADFLEALPNNAAAEAIYTKLVARQVRPALARAGCSG